MRAPEIWSRNDAVSRLALAGLAPLGGLYNASVAWRARHARPYRARAKVVCVGGLTAGGSGKTPVAMAVADAAKALGLKPVFLSRGYRGRLRGPLEVDPRIHVAEDVGDEPLLLARVAPAVIARARDEGARLADALKADVIVMDDGHQNFSIEKDLSLVVVDAEEGFGNRRVLPAGPLRENVAQGLSRADAVVVVGSGPLPRLDDFRGAILRARIEPDRSVPLAGARLVAFAGIGRPKKFFDSLERLGATIIEAKAFGDHHAYAAADLAELKARARASDARLYTTEKDFARLSAEDREGISALPVRAVFDEPAQFHTLLDSLARKAIARAPT
jgi:tetraacyldisaccharide 4'-kinase